MYVTIRSLKEPIGTQTLHSSTSPESAPQLTSVLPSTKEAAKLNFGFRCIISDTPQKKSKSKRNSANADACARYTEYGALQRPYNEYYAKILGEMLSQKFEPEVNVRSQRHFFSGERNACSGGRTN